MKKWCVVPLIMALMFGATILLAEEEKKQDQKPEQKESAKKEGSATSQPTSKPTTKATTKPSKIANKYCAVDGPDTEVDPDYTVEHKGKLIGFCCKDCIKDFKKDPDKYVKNMK